MSQMFGTPELSKNKNIFNKMIYNKLFVLLDNFSGDWAPV